MPITNLEPNIEYILGLINQNEIRTHSIQYTIINCMCQLTSCAYDPMTGSISILTLKTLCTSHSATNMLTLLSETTAQHFSVRSLNRVCTMQLIKIHGKLQTPRYHKDPKEDINLLGQLNQIILDTRLFHSEIILLLHSQTLIVLSTTCIEHFRSGSG